jgi:hypothetical protein
MLAGAFLLIVGATPALADSYRPDAEGYPCAQRARLGIVQSENGFSIREAAESTTPRAVAEPIPTPSVMTIKLGHSVSIDSRILARTSLVRTESPDAPQR